MESILWMIGALGVAISIYGKYAYWRSDRALAQSAKTRAQ